LSSNKLGDQCDNTRAHCRELQLRQLKGTLLSCLRGGRNGIADFPSKC
jgi:hypothetical protein